MFRSVLVGSVVLLLTLLTLAALPAVALAMVSSVVVLGVVR